MKKLEFNFNKIYPITGKIGSIHLVVAAFFICSRFFILK
jgi:hypothetical protein